MSPAGTVSPRKIKNGRFEIPQPEFVLRAALRIPIREETTLKLCFVEKVDKISWGSYIRIARSYEMSFPIFHDNCLFVGKLVYILRRESFVANIGIYVGKQKITRYPITNFDYSIPSKLYGVVNNLWPSSYLLRHVQKLFGKKYTLVNRHVQSYC